MQTCANGFNPLMIGAPSEPTIRSNSSRQTAKTSFNPLMIGAPSEPTPARHHNRVRRALGFQSPHDRGTF